MMKLATSTKRLSWIRNKRIHFHYWNLSLNVQFVITKPVFGCALHVNSVFVKDVDIRPSWQPRVLLRKKLGLWGIFKMSQLRISQLIWGAIHGNVLNAQILLSLIRLKRLNFSAWLVAWGSLLLHYLKMFIRRVTYWKIRVSSRENKMISLNYNVRSRRMFRVCKWSIINNSLIKIKPFIITLVKLFQ